MSSNEPPPYPGDEPGQPPPYGGATPPPPPPPQYPGAPPGYYPPPTGYAYPMAPQQNQKALWAMILGIGAIAGAIIFFCFYIVGLLCGIPAIVLGMLAKKEIDGSHGAQTGRGMATAGLVTGIIGVVLNLALLAFFIALIATEGFGDPNW